MVSKTRRMAGNSHAPAVIPDTITDPVRNGAPLARDSDVQRARSPAQAASVAETRRDEAMARDRLDAERWLDEGGSFINEAVTPDD
jgi:hypothetical protein